MAAFFVALAMMPLHVYNFSRREIGTSHTAPWLTTAAADFIRSAAAHWRSFMSFFRAPGGWRVAQLAAAAVFVAIAMHDLQAAVDNGPSLAIVMALPELRENINKLGTDMEAILKKAQDENRDMTTEEESTFDRMDADREKLLAQEKRQAKVESFGQAGGRQTEHRQPSNQARASEHRDAKLVKLDSAEALRGWLMVGSDEGPTEESRAAAARLGMSLDRKRLNIRLAPAAPASLRADDMSDWAKRYLGVDVISPDVGGHFTVPDETMRSLETALLAHGGMRSVASVMRTNTGAALPTPTLNDTDNEGALLGENTEHTELDAEFGQLVLEAYKYTSRRIMVSVEYLQDNAINAAEVIGRLLGDRIARITNRHFTVGTGSSQPKGIVIAGTSSGITAADDTSVTYDELVDLEHSVDPAYRIGARFMFHDNMLKVLKKIKVPQFSGDTQGQPLWRAGMTASDPDTINGYAYTINQHMPVPTAGLKALVFGQLSKYQIRDVRDVTLVRLDERYAELGMVAFLAFSRHDGDLLDAGTNPVKYLTMGA